MVFHMNLGILLKLLLSTSNDLLIYHSSQTPVFPSLLQTHNYQAVLAYLHEHRSHLKIHRELIYSHFRDKAHEINCDIELILDIIVIITNSQQNVPHDYQISNILRNMLRKSIQNGDGKYTFMMYKLKVNELEEEQQKMKWLVGVGPFIGYFLNLNNSAMMEDFSQLILQLKTAFGHLMKQNLEIIRQKIEGQNDTSEENIEMMKNQYYGVIAESLNIMHSLFGNTWCTNNRVNSFISDLIPQQLYFAHQSMPYFSILYSMIASIPSSIANTSQLAELPPFIFINAFTYIYGSLYNVKNHLIIYFLAKVLLILLPSSATAKPLEFQSTTNENHLNKLVRLFCQLVSENELWSNPKILFYQREDLICLNTMEIVRRLIIYLGFISPKNQASTYELINNAIIQNNNAPLVNKLRFLAYSLSTSIHNNQPKEYHIYLLNIYRNTFLTVRKLPITQKFEASQTLNLTFSVLTAEITYAGKFSDTNHIGHIISFLMNFCAVLNSSVFRGIRTVFERLELLKILETKSKILEQILEEKAKNIKNEFDEDQIDVCKLRLKDLGDLYKKPID